MWRLLGKTAHLWPSWLYKIISKTHSKIMRLNHTNLGEMIIGDQILLLETLGNKTNKIRKHLLLMQTIMKITLLRHHIVAMIKLQIGFIIFHLIIYLSQ